MSTSPVEVTGHLANKSEFSVELTQIEAWREQIAILKSSLDGYEGSIFFEYSIPRMGRRIDVVLLMRHVIFVIEFKVGASSFNSEAIDQVWDYALDLKNFHENSHSAFIAPILVSTNASNKEIDHSYSWAEDNVFAPIRTTPDGLRSTIERILILNQGPAIVHDHWIEGRYSPTPTIIEAARALFNNHSVVEISRSDASASNLTTTRKIIDEIIRNAQTLHTKAICFVTGVPGAGKTLVGLDIAGKTLANDKATQSVFLSGNGPLVNILREALARDKVARDKALNKKTKKGIAMSEVKLFIQNVHHFRDEGLSDRTSPPFEHVAIFDEAQRAWNLEKTMDFMRRKKKVADFSFSESEFLISCMDRHHDWAVVICLVGGGQEIHTGEAGISEWITSLNRSFPNWSVYISSRLKDDEYAAGKALHLLKDRKHVHIKDELHLSVSMRSFRAEHLSRVVKSLLDMDIENARKNHDLVKNKYPIVITRDLAGAKKWLKRKARGNERYGIVVSSQAQRLKPHAIDVRSPMDPVHWFLDGKDDVRSSYYLEDVATEFHIQGLELDWACVTWDADFRYSEGGWQTYSFVGDRWNQIRKPERKQYLKNAYRVLLTRARQGMVIVVPPGDIEDHTRLPSFYDDTFAYLKYLGFQEI